MPVVWFRRKETYDRVGKRFAVLNADRLTAWLMEDDLAFARVNGPGEMARCRHSVTQVDVLEDVL